ncbi:MAG: hypothetical protein KGL95_07865, partial [Patescibacteria group bacterium]|nr:hypothetical protein [Patescibacteria group bacterium]
LLKQPNLFYIEHENHFRKLMNERDFLRTLEKRAQEQEKIMHGVPFPETFTAISIWLGTHPWRILIPIAFVITVLLQAIFERRYDTFVLRLLGGF